MANGINPLDLTDRTVLVTGASSGIGRETAVILSELGSKLILTGRRVDQLEKTLGRMAEGAHAIEPFDLTELEMISEWVKTLTDRYGSLHGLVHAAGMQETACLRALSLEVLHQTFRVNFDSAVMLAKGFRQKGCCGSNSSIVFSTSIRGIVGAPAKAAYAGSKAALVGLTRSLASELARESIRVNCIAPGMVQSEMTDQIQLLLPNIRWGLVRCGMWPVQPPICFQTRRAG